MTVESFLILLAILSTVTSLATEGVKKFLDEMKFKYASNVLVLAVAVFVGSVGTAVFYLFNDYAWTSLNIIVMFLMMVANWLGAMFGYDKVKQTILQMTIK